jgi:PAS domain S-box-containing protein
MLPLEFAYVRIAGAKDAWPFEAIRSAHQEYTSVETSNIRCALDRWMAPQLSASRLLIDNPIGEGFLMITAFPLRPLDNNGILVAASTRSDFPTQIEDLLLRAAVNQACTAIQEAWRRAERQPAADQLAAGKRTEEALRQSEERFRRYFELGLVGMAMTSPEKGIFEVNDEICRILGYQRIELLQKTWAELTHPDDVAADVQQFNRVLKGEIDGYTLDKRWIRKDGRVIDSIMSAKCLRHADGSVNYFIGLLQDITLRKQAQEEQRRLAALVENSPYFIGIASLDGHAQIVNSAGRAMVGLENAAQVLQTRVLDFIAEGDQEEFQQHVLATVLREGQWEGESRFRHFKTGATIPTMQRIFLMREPGTDRPVAMGTFAFDVSERKRSEEALRSAQAQLAHIARVNTMGELTASIAHEMNQPLAAIVTNGDAALRWLGQTPPNVPEAQTAIEETVRQGHRASDVITRIRSLLRRSPRDLSAVNLNRVIDEVLALTSHQLAENSVKVRTQFQVDLPFVTGDFVQLQQVLVNLILNAIEAITAHNAVRDLVLTTERQGTGEVLIRVHDSGTGIDPRHADQLFHPFVTTKATGLGMGLAISRSIIEAHGGRLWSTPNETHGATFQFSLPLRTVE